MKTDTFWYLFSYRPHWSGRKHWRKRQCITSTLSFFGTVLIKVHLWNGFRMPTCSSAFVLFLVRTIGENTKKKFIVFSYENALLWSGMVGALAVVHFKMFWKHFLLHLFVFVFCFSFESCKTTTNHKKWTNKFQGKYLQLPRSAAGFAQAMENLESHGILKFQFPGLESPEI